MRHDIWTECDGVWVVGRYRIERLSAEFWVLTLGGSIVDSGSSPERLAYRAARGRHMLRLALDVVALVLSLAGLVAASFLESWAGVCCVVVASTSACIALVGLSSRLVSGRGLRILVD